MRILYVARQPPVALDNGSRIRTNALVRQLARSASVHLLAFASQPGSGMAAETEERVAEALPELEAVTLVAPRRGAKRRLQLETLAGRGSYLFRQHRSGAMRTAIERSIDRLRPDLVHFDNLLLGGFGAVVPGSLVRTIAPENVDSVLLQRMGDTSASRLRGALYAREARLLAGWEAAHLPAFDLCLAVSEEDRRTFAALGARAICIPNGVARHPRPAPARPLPAGEPLKLLFVGSGTYEPNRTGVAWFIERVLPLAGCQLEPQLTLVGSGWEGFAGRRCQVAGRVESLDPYYTGHDVALVPLRSGGGSRLKVAEALAKGIPLLGTHVGLEGYPLEPGVHALFGDTPEELAAGLRRLEQQLRTETAIVDRQITAGFQLVERFFWDEIGSALTRAYAAEVARRDAAPARAHTLGAAHRAGRQAREPESVVGP